MLFPEEVFDFGIFSRDDNFQIVEKIWPPIGTDFVFNLFSQALIFVHKLKITSPLRFFFFNTGAGGGLRH